MFGIYRFLLALNVVFFHILKIPNIGPFAVYSFFILSGFLMTAIMHKTYSYSPQGFKKYAANRFLRLFPTYWGLVLITLILIAIVGQDFATAFHPKMAIPDTWYHWLANLTLVFPYVTPVDYPVRLAPSTWALTIELFFYMLIGLGVSRTKKVTLIWLIISVALLIVNNVSTKQFGLGYGSIFTASFPFALGAVLYHYKDQFKGIVMKVNLSIAIALFTLNLLLAALANTVFAAQGWKVALLTSYINIFLSAVMLLRLYYLPKQSGKWKQADTLLGDLSYPVYVFHWAGACLAAWLFANMSSGTYLSTVEFLCGLAITLLVSLWVNHAVNLRAEKLRNKVKRSLA